MIKIARQLGHDPTLTLGTYGHLLDEYAEGDRVSAEDRIRTARQADVSEKCPSDSDGHDAPTAETAS